MPLTRVSLDLKGLDGRAVGDEITLLGRDGDEELTLEELASWRETSVHDMLLGFEGRLRARYSDDATR